MNIYLGHIIYLAILREAGGPRAVGDQFGHHHSSQIGGHWDAGGKETRRGASAKRRIPAGNIRLWSNTAGNSCLNKVSARAGRLVVIIREWVMRERPILVAMSMVSLMLSLSDNSQGCNAENKKLAKHLCAKF